jgi:hypothetical protein
MLNNSVVRSASLKPRTPVQRLSAANQGVVAQAGTYKVAIMGAAGEGSGRAGQALALLIKIKMSPLVSAPHLYDAANAKGGADLPPAAVERAAQGSVHGREEADRTGPERRRRGGRRGDISLFLQSIIINCECG